MIFSWQCSLKARQIQLLQCYNESDNRSTAPHAHTRTHTHTHTHTHTLKHPQIVLLFFRGGGSVCGVTILISGSSNSKGCDSQIPFFILRPRKICNFPWLSANFINPLLSLWSSSVGFNTCRYFLKVKRHQVSNCYDLTWNKQLVLLIVVEMSLKLVLLTTITWSIRK